VTILKIILEKYDEMIWIGFVWGRLGIGKGLL
jgi:hypothetical protein